jgi:hypothetical protein
VGTTPISRATLTLTLLATAACLGGQLRAGEEAGPANGARSGQVVLGRGSQLRCFMTYRTMLLCSDGAQHREAENSKRHGEARTPFPPAGWQKPEFPDRGWVRTRVPTRSKRKYMNRDYGHISTSKNAKSYPLLALFCARGRFEVPDPAAVRGLKITVHYRGGAVLYVNGREAGRGHMPGGKLSSGTPAEKYPVEVFEAGGKPIVNERSAISKHGKSLELRVRRLEVAVDAKLLSRGTNVLAVAIHRAPFLERVYKKTYYRGRGNLWATCGLVALEVRADSGVKANVGRPDGVQVWTASTAERIFSQSHADALEGTGTLEIAGTRNGTFCGQVVVSSGAEIRGVKAVAGELKHEGGKGTIPASAVEVLYARHDMEHTSGAPTGQLDGLYAEPPASVPVRKIHRNRGPEGTPGAVQPVWVRVKVPSDAAPGSYRGSLAVTAGARRVDVPVRLRVLNWKLPDPRDFAGHMGAWQSPESVAMKYKVGPWSEKHWKLLDESWGLMGELGCNLAVVYAIEKTNRGNERAMVRWVKNPSTNGSGQAGGGKYTYDMSIVDRYLATARKHCRIDYVILWVHEQAYGGYWRYGSMEALEKKGKVKITGPLFTLLDAKTGKLETLEGPRYDKTPEKAKAFVAPMIAELIKTLKKHDIDLVKNCVLGLGGDSRPSKGAVRVFKELLPGTLWSSAGHYDRRGQNFHGVPVGYHSACYAAGLTMPTVKRRYGWQGIVCPQFPRHVGGGNALWPVSPLPQHRMAIERFLMSNRNGIGNFGVDFWAVTDRKREGNRGATLNARYAASDWGQRNMPATTEHILSPGPDGPVRTIRSEIIREGAQEAEARIFIEKAILSKKLPADLAGRAQAVLDERQWLIHAADVVLRDWKWLEGDLLRLELAEKLFSCAAEVQEALKG